MRVLLKVSRTVAGWSDPLSRDLSRSGDHFVARFRLGLLALLTLVPTTASLANPGQVENWLGLASIAVALAFAVWFERLAARPVPPGWLGFATSQFDVAIISLGFVSFIAAGRPIVASNSLVHYTMYFVALAGTGLRYDPRVCLAAGGAALVQYGGIVTWVGLFEPQVWTMHTIYGAFQWDSQVSRLQLIAVATIIQAASVVRSRAFWLGSMRDQLTQYKDTQKAGVEQTQTATTADVPLIGITRLEKDRAQLLAQLNVSSTQNGVAADSRSGMVIVSLEKQDGNWLISEIRDQ